MSNVSRPLTVLAAGLVLALSVVRPLPAQTAVPEGAAALSVRLEDLTVRPKGAVPLSAFSPQPGPLRLRDEAGEQAFFIPLAATAVVRDMILTLRYTNSVALRPERSVLAVRLNEATLAQIRLDPTQPSGEARVRLPADGWRSGFNKLTLAVTQHYADSCEDSVAPELWTEVDLSQSFLSYDLGPLTRPLLLSDLSALFSPGLGGQREVTLLTPPGAGADRLRSQALPSVAQALALRRQFAPLEVRQRDWSGAGLPTDVSGAVQVVVGLPQDLAQVLPPQALPVVDGPKVAISGLGDGRARLLVTGRTEDEVIAAARSLTVMDDAQTPDSQATFPQGGLTAAPLPLDGRVSMVGGKTYRFQALGFRTATARGKGSHQISVPLPMAPDYYTYENAKVTLKLDFSYGAGMGAGSVLNFRVNDEQIHGHSMGNPDGGSFRDYLITFPVNLLKPGANALNIDISSQPPVSGGECVGSRGRHLLVQVSENSVITLPEAGRAAALPDLARFATSGYPYAGGDGRAAGAVYVGSADLIGPALTLIGRMAQVAHGPVDGLAVITGLPQPLPGQALVLATTAQLQRDDFAAWAASLSKIRSWPYRALQDLRTTATGPELSLGSLHGLISRADSGPAVPDGEWVQQKSSLGDRAVMAALRNPAGHDGALLTVVAAETPAVLAARIADLVGPGLWGQMRGDLIAWGEKDEALFTLQVSEPYQVGRDDPLLLLRLTLSTTPWYWLAGAVAVCGLITLLLWQMIRRRRKRFMETQ